MSGDDMDHLDELALDKDFVLMVLDDPNVLNELNRQNNRLIDFICTGYVDDAQPDASPLLSNGDGITSPELGTSLSTAEDVPTPTPSTTATTPGTPVLEVLVSLIVDSVDWFDRNEKLLFQLDNDEEMVGEDTGLDREEVSKLMNRIHIASEILSCKIWLISETLVEEPALLTKLWTFLEHPLKSASPSVQFFVKINEQLLESRPDQMLNFIRSQANIVDLFIKHIDITIIMDFLLRIIASDKPDVPKGIIEILGEQKLIPKLLHLLEEETDTSTQSSCGDFLKALISISANTSIDENTIGPNLLTKELVGDECVDEIIRIIHKRGNGLSTIVGVIIEIIRKNNSDYDQVNLLYTTLEKNPPSPRDPIYLGGMLRKFADNLDSFNDILIDPQLTSKRIKTQINTEIEPLGFKRFKVCELVAELLHCSNIGLLNNHLTEKIIEERENFLKERESNLANALSDDLLSTSANAPAVTPVPGLTLSNLNIGAAEPSVAVSEKHITVSPHTAPASNTDRTGDLPLLEETEPTPEPVISKQDTIRTNPTVGDYFKIKLVDSTILQTIIGLFNKYPWNNFWHNVVFDVVQQIFNGRLDVGYNQFLIFELFRSCDITNLIIDSYNLCVETEEQTSVRLGYMGHLVLIAEEVVKFSSQFQNTKLNDAEIDELIYSKLIDENWISYVTNVLTETREQYNCVLGGIKTNEFQQSEYLNHDAIILGNSEDEIMGQEVEGQTAEDDVDGAPLDDVFYESSETADSDGDESMGVS